MNVINTVFKFSIKQFETVRNINDGTLALEQRLLIPEVYSNLSRYGLWKYLNVKFQR